jgi:hypothetical protein
VIKCDEEMTREMMKLKKKKKKKKKKRRRRRRKSNDDDHADDNDVCRGAVHCQCPRKHQHCCPV